VTVEKQLRSGNKSELTSEMSHDAHLPYQIIMNICLLGNTATNHRERNCWAIINHLQYILYSSCSFYEYKYVYSLYLTRLGCQQGDEGVACRERCGTLRGHRTGGIEHCCNTENKPFCPVIFTLQPIQSMDRQGGRKRKPTHSKVSSSVSHTEDSHIRKVFSFKRPSISI